MDIFAFLWHADFVFVIFTGSFSSFLIFVFLHATLISAPPVPSFSGRFGCVISFRFWNFLRSAQNNTWNRQTLYVIVITLCDEVVYWSQGKSPPVVMDNQAVELVQQYKSLGPVSHNILWAPGWCARLQFECRHDFYKNVLFLLV